MNGKFEVIVASKRYKRGFNQLTIDGNGFIWWATTAGTYKYNEVGEELETHLLDSYEWNGDRIHYVPQFFDSHGRHY